MKIYVNPFETNRKLQSFLFVFDGGVTHLFTFGSPIVALRNEQTGERSSKLSRDKYMLSNSIFNHSASYAQLHAYPHRQPNHMHGLYSKATHTYVYTKSLTHSFPLLLVILTHN